MGQYTIRCLPFPLLKAYSLSRIERRLILVGKFHPSCELSNARTPLHAPGGSAYLHEISARHATFSDTRHGKETSRVSEEEQSNYNLPWSVDATPHHGVELIAWTNHK